MSNSLSVIKNAFLNSLNEVEKKYGVSKSNLIKVANINYVTFRKIENDGENTEFVKHISSFLKILSLLDRKNALELLDTVMKTERSTIESQVNSLRNTEGQTKKRRGRKPKNKIVEFEEEKEDVTPVKQQTTQNKIVFDDDEDYEEGLEDYEDEELFVEDDYTDEEDEIYVDEDDDEDEVVVKY